MQVFRRKGTVNQEPRAIPPEKKWLEIVKKIPCLYNQTVIDSFVKELIEKANRMDDSLRRFAAAKSNLLFSAWSYLDPNQRMLSGDPGMDALVEEIGIQFETMKKEISLLYTVLSESIIAPQIDLFFTSKDIISCF